MKKNKGFTLIELLAVIVILAVIALIATPLIMKVIDDVRKNSSKDSVYGYIEAAEVSISTELMNNPDINYYGEYEISSNKLVGTKDEISVNSKGSKVEGTVYIENNIVKRATLSTGGYDLTYYDSKAYVLGRKIDNPDTYADGTAVYFNPETGKKCNESEAVSSDGTKTGCMKWYTFGDKEGNTTVKLLLDHNVANSKWVSKEDYVASGGIEEDYNKNTYVSGGVTYVGGSNELGPITLLKTLRNSTSTWKSELNSRIITSAEIAKIVGKTDFDVTTSTSYFYLDGGKGTDTSWHTQIANSTNKSDYAWLYDYLNSCEQYGCNTRDQNASWAYWTSDACDGGSSLAWYVGSNGTLHHSYPVASYGVRPVITVSKSTLN